jgi:hypothetical protein
MKKNEEIEMKNKRVKEKMIIKNEKKTEKKTITI